MTNPLLRCLAIPFICLASVGTNPTGAQDVGGGANPSACERELRKLGPRRLGEKYTAPLRTRRGSPAWPAIPDGTTGSGVWIGEILIDVKGGVSHVWTIRDVQLTPSVPSLTKSITDAVAKWQFAPAAVDRVPVPICLTVTVNVNLKTIRGGQ